VRQPDTEAAEAMAQTVETPPRRAAPAASIAEENAAPVAAPIPWLNIQKLPKPIPFAQPVTQRDPAPDAQSDGGTAIVTGAVPERVTDSRVAVPNRPAPGADSNATRTHRAREQREQQARPEPPAPAIAHIDHTFALLMIMFAALAIAGPALHFVERRRRREAVNFRPPPWARVVALNAPTPRILVTPRPHAGKPAAPMPIRPPDQTERLAHALQQLADRLQTTDRPGPKAVRVRPRSRAST
jgi:hypothetical protein